MKNCACGAAYSLAGWAALRTLGRQDYLEDGDQRLDLRNCSRCHSTMGMVIALETPDLIIYEAPE